MINLGNTVWINKSSKTFEKQPFYIKDSVEINSIESSFIFAYRHPIYGLIDKAVWNSVFIAVFESLRGIENLHDLPSAAKCNSLKAGWMKNGFR